MKTADVGGARDRAGDRRVALRRVSSLCETLSLRQSVRCFDTNRFV